MKAFTTLLCGAALAVAATSPVLAGGKSTTGASTTAPAVVTAVTNRPRVTINLTVSQEITSSEVAQLIAALSSQYASLMGVPEDDLDIQIQQAQ